MFVLRTVVGRCYCVCKILINEQTLKSFPKEGRCLYAPAPHSRHVGAIIIIINLEHSIRTFVCLHCDVMLETLLNLHYEYNMKVSSIPLINMVSEVVKVVSYYSKKQNNCYYSVSEQLNVLCV